MNTVAIERLNRNKETATYICAMVCEWMQALDVCNGLDFTWEKIDAKEWNCFIEDITRYLNERDSE